MSRRQRRREWRRLKALERRHVAELESLRRWNDFDRLRLKVVRAERDALSAKLQQLLMELDELRNGRVISRGPYGIVVIGR
jgi:transposase